jgi:hypothetical protein
MVKKSFTLIEIIFVIVILGLISVGSFKALQMLYQRYYQVNTITKFSIISQTLLDEITQIVYYRVPITAIGYSPSDGEFKKLSEVDDEKYKIFEWISGAFDAKLHFKDYKGYTGFIDLDASDRNTLTLVAKDFNITDINDTLNSVFNNQNDLNQTVGIIFAGDLDYGIDSSDYKNSYGWHGHDHKKLYLINKFTQDENDANLTMNDDIKGNKIYAKYYLVASAWGISRGADIDKSASCLDGLNINDNTLLLFYNYRPWNNETFCADPHQNDTEEKKGNVAILAQNITSFRVKDLNTHIEIKVQLQKSLYRGSDKNITITKQKVTF